MDLHRAEKPSIGFTGVRRKSSGIPLINQPHQSITAKDKPRRRTKRGCEVRE
jgi:hypothetical protein